MGQIMIGRSYSRPKRAIRRPTYLEDYA